MASTRKPGKHFKHIKLTIIRGRNMPKMDLGKKGTCDTFVVITGSCIRTEMKTIVIHDSYDPVWHETNFLIDGNDDDYIILTAYDFDRFSDNDAIGNVKIKIAELITIDGPTIIALNKTTDQVNPHYPTENPSLTIECTILHTADSLGKDSVPFVAPKPSAPATPMVVTPTVVDSAIPPVVAQRRRHMEDGTIKTVTQPMAQPIAQTAVQPMAIKQSKPLPPIAKAPIQDDFDCEYYSDDEEIKPASKPPAPAPAPIKPTVHVPPPTVVAPPPPPPPAVAPPPPPPPKLSAPGPGPSVNTDGASGATGTSALMDAIRNQKKKPMKTSAEIDAELNRKQSSAPVGIISGHGSSPTNDLASAMSNAINKRRMAIDSSDD